MKIDKMKIYVGWHVEIVTDIFDNEPQCWTQFIAMFNELQEHFKDMVVVWRITPYAESYEDMWHVRARVLFVNEEDWEKKPTYGINYFIQKRTMTDRDEIFVEDGNAIS